MGIPEYVSGRYQIGGATRTRLAHTGHLAAKPPVFIVRPSNAEEHHRESLGHQYVFGIFPVTRLFLEHGAESDLTEMLVDTVAQEGLSPILVSEKAAPEIFKTLNAPFFIRSSLRAMSVNAYDMVFVRNVSVDGALILERIAPDSSVVAKTEEPISRSQYLSQGHGPVLAASIEKSLQSAVRNALPKVGPAHRRRIPATSASREQAAISDLAIIEFPKIRGLYSATVGQAISDSYGFSGQSPFSQASVLRIIQRGVEQGIDSVGVANISLASVDADQPEASANPASLWYLSSTISSLEPETSRGRTDITSIYMVVDFEARSTVGYTATQLFHVQCAKQVMPKSGSDGFWRTSLEDASREMAREMFSLLRSTGENTICRINDA